MTRAAVYTRISQDSEGKGLGVARQERECRALCEREGWSVTFVATDNDLSAYSGKRRPGFESVLDAIKAGTVDALVAMHPDRITRRFSELSDIITVIETTGTRIATVSAGHYDLSTASGRMVARVVGATAAEQSERGAERLKSMHADKARRGEPVGRRAFGWTQDGKIDRREATLIRAAAKRILAGTATWATVADDWTAKKVPTVQGAAKWSSTAVKKILTNPRVAGHRVHNGEIVAKGTWTPILDETTWARLTARSATASRAGHARRRVGLSGLIVCGKCGAKMHRNTMGGKPQWSCSACRGVTVGAAYIEPLVADAVAAVLPTLDLGSPDQDEKDVLTAELGTLAELLAAGELHIAAYGAASKAITARLDALATETRTATALDGLTNLSAEQLLELSDDAQAVVYSSVISAVTVAPSGRGARFNPDRISIQWIA